MTSLEGLFGRVAAALDRAGVPFMVAGSFASTAHGFPRATQDLDLVIDPPDAEALEALLRALPASDYYVDSDAARDALRRRSMFNVVDHATGWKIDFILRKDRPFSRREFERRQPISLLGVAAFVASPEDTIIAKLEWSLRGGGSERQRRDVAGILETLAGQLDRAYIEEWVRELGLAAEWLAAQGMTTA
jgi:hypothetical protein